MYYKNGSEMYAMFLKSSYANELAETYR